MKFRTKFCIFLAFLPAFFFVIFLILDSFYPLNLHMLEKQESKILKDKNEQIIAMQISDDEIWRFYVNSNQIPNMLKQSTIFFEDRYFYCHFGVNPASILRAFWHNLTSKNRVGASTITMQVARMMNPKERTYTNKIVEIFNAFQLEWHFSKDEILTMYFNLAPYGGNIEGVKAASFFYFHKDLPHLSIAQMALLSTIPKNPNQNRLDRHSNVNSLKNSLVGKLYQGGIIDKSSYKRAKEQKFSPKRYAYINQAQIYSDIAFKNGLKTSNLNLNLQNALLNFLKKEMKTLKNKKVENASAVMIDNQKMQVIAYISSHNQNAKNGQNDGVKSLKNVGSTLKPFIYSLALDNGLITPQKELIDTEIYLSEYIPKNYNKGFVGIISASDALGFSLNIPAVKLNNILAKDSLYELLKKAGLTPFEKEHYGESIALGGISLSLLDLAHLYTIYANGGALKPLEVAGDIIDKNVSLISPQSAYLTAQMLLNAPRAYLNSVWKNTLYKPKIMFKTGTSANAIDLYTIGISKKYTIAVWMGNFDGSKTDELSGGSSAAKVVFDMFEYLEKSEGVSEFNQPTGIEKRKICVDAYELKNECKNLQTDFLIDSVKLKNDCEFYRNEELFYLLESGYITQDEVKNSRCFYKFQEIKPLISNLDKTIISLNGANSRLGIKCTAILGDEIYIKFDDENFKKVKNAKTIFKSFDIGKHEVLCLDENSNLSTFEFEVVKFR
ncbi:penicillin-binding protein 1C [Campylobacter geochelonis]|uniref:penicillin-binding protein 1C n=1 Tax=Campylobacter geochelonis TaxID=1780362 RepID=UPI00077074C9|nr:penicillin-binding protein 1C [Campylobacter geochelonis]CZE51463.1 penicillin-binding protein [Campylobacter geochelonis]